VGTSRIESLRRVISLCAALSFLGTFATDTKIDASSVPRPQYYLSLGDSWAVGFQSGVASGDETLHGYSNLVVSDVKHKRHLVLENYGCNGAVTSDLLSVVGCTTGGVALDAVQYPTTTQLQAAVDFIANHPHQIGLITVSIGTNDYYSKVPSSTITANIETIVKQLRRVAGKTVPIIGLGMDDAYLDGWLPNGSGASAAAATVQAIEHTANPAIEAGYVDAGAAFVNVGQLFETYVPFSTLTDDPTYGEIPVSVYQICRLTSMCADGDPHPTHTGYAIIAAQIVKSYLKLLGYP
jgi:lysophospholipase L1-like esterase